MVSGCLAAWLLAATGELVSSVRSVCASVCLWMAAGSTCMGALTCLLPLAFGFQPGPLGEVVYVDVTCVGVDDPSCMCRLGELGLGWACRQGIVSSNGANSCI